MTTSAAPLVQLCGIGKSFGELRANHQINLDLVPGQVLALLGENGAGKSTLMSILSGQLQPSAGTILVDGQVARFASSQQAITAGIGMVYQHFKLVEAMTVAENVLLGERRQVFLHPRQMHRQVAELAAQFGMKVDPAATIADLSMGEKQQVEILKLLYRQSRILIFDEPTAVLTPTEADKLFATIRLMRAEGKAIVFISHKLEEVMAIADRIAILRRGEIVAKVDAAAVASTAELAELMVGRRVLLEVDKPPVPSRQIVLKVTDLCLGRLRDASLEVRQGEILGIVGVAGNGQKQLVQAICGLQPPDSGSVRILGEDASQFFASRRWDQALSYIPEDRQGLATCPGLDLVDNFLLTTRGGFVSGPWLKRRAASDKAARLVEDFSIRPGNLSAQAWQLSGGNLQKLVLAREFYRQPRLIVAEQPTQGLDIAATEDVWKLLLEAREQAGVVLVSGDLNEALSLCDTIAVLFDGRLVDSFATDDTAKVAAIPQMMAGLAG